MREIRDATKIENGQTATSSEEPEGEKPEGSEKIYLEEIFYVSSKRSSLYRVRLTEGGLTLRKESSCSIGRTDSIPSEDIIGCRCLRSMKKKNSNTSCVCSRPSSMTKRNQSKLVESTEHVQPNDEFDTSAYVYIYAYVLKKPNKRRERMTIALRFQSFDRYEDNLREATRWRLAIKCLCSKLAIPKSYLSPTHRNLQDMLHACPEESKKLLVILNPKSGPGRAREIFQRRIHPILSEAERPYEIFITKHSNYAKDFIRTRDLSQWSGLVLVGGDGIVFEAINGLLQRSDWEKIMKELPIGIVPCGSGNGLAKSIAYLKKEPYDQNPLLISGLSLVRRNTTEMDLVRIETRNQIYYSFLAVGWGFLADIDIESERLRAIGAQRFIVWSVARLINLKTYRGTVSYLPCDKSTNSIRSNSLVPNGVGKINGKLSHSKSCDDRLDNYNSDINQMKESKSYEDAFESDYEAGFEADTKQEIDPLDDSQLISSALKLETESSGGRIRIGSFYSAVSYKSTYFSTSSGSVSSTYHSMEDVSQPPENGEYKNIMYGPASNLPALPAKLPNDWTVIEGEFVMVHAAYQSHMSADCLFAPKAKLADGIIWLLIIKAGISRANLLQFLLGFSSGVHLACPGVEMVPVKAFRIEPAEGTSGLLTVDGEKVDYGPLQGEVFSKLATVMCP